MKSIELLFLVMFILIIYVALIKDMDSNMIIAMSSIWFVVLWIGWDNMGAWKNNKIQLVAVNPEPPQPALEPPSGLPALGPPSGLPALGPPQSASGPPQSALGPPASDNPEQTTERLYAELGCDSGSIGDNLIAKKMKQMSSMNKVAIDSYRKQNKNTNMNYFIDELKNHANSVWWDDETLENEF